MRACWIRRVVVLVISVSFADFAGAAETKPNVLSPEELSAGWILLFDGETDFGWKAASNANWKVAEGILSASEGDPGLLVTTTQFGDYVLKADFRAAKAANSGIFLRTPPSPKKGDVKNRCYEINIAPPDSDYPTGSLVERAKAAAVKENTEWRTFEITADGGKFVVLLDGQKVLEYSDPKPLGRGFIGLQFRQGKIEFRNVKLKPLGLKSLFNGKDLSGWKPAGESTATVTPEGAIRLKNGKGQLESEGRFADFVLQLEIFVNGKALNSGVFFRSIPGEMMNGYESQIHNAFQDGDRTKPADHGTGGIFRRQPARKVVANDQEWFHKTLITAGPHVAAWVNGYQVTDWTDTRKPDPNPRKGLRRDAGTLIFQGHDATTDLSFRNIRAGEIAPREPAK